MNVNSNTTNASEQSVWAGDFNAGLSARIANVEYLLTVVIEHLLMPLAFYSD